MEFNRQPPALASAVVAAPVAGLVEMKVIFFPWIHDIWQFAFCLHTPFLGQTTPENPSVLRFWPSRCAFNYSFIFEGAPTPISTDNDGSWVSEQISFSPFPNFSRLVIDSDYIWQVVFSSEGAGGGSKAPRRAPPDLPSDLGKIPFHTQTALECRVMKNGPSQIPIDSTAERKNTFFGGHTWDRSTSTLAAMLGRTEHIEPFPAR